MLKKTATQILKNWKLGQKGEIVEIWAFWLRWDNFANDSFKTNRFFLQNNK